MSGEGKAAGKAPAVPRPAATAIILRDGSAGLEVFMVVRHHEIDFASGALVFPGGKVDEQDADPAWAELAPSAASAPDRAFLVAAARETFEEAGLLLARRRGGSELVDAATAHALVQRYRARMLAGKATFLDLVRAEDLLLTPDLMVRFAHWITPETQPKRFDTHFLLVSAPMAQLGAHDGGESVEGFWIAPAQALREAEAGARTLLFPTHMNLLKLAQHRSVAEAVAAARMAKIVTVTPRVERTPTGRKLHIPAEAGYGITEYVPLPPAAKA
jgi:8-oxo-dGTP pyrophosphatase MutT (NUDIX family)